MAKRKISTFQLVRSPSGVEEPETPPEPELEGFQYIQSAFKPFWGERSYYKRPWRSYMQVVSAVDFQNGLGINFNCKTGQAKAAAELLSRAGFKRARIEIGFGSIQYNGSESTPTELISSQKTSIKTRVEALKENGIRPLVLLNANHGDPCPSTALSNITVKTEAPIGATTIQLEGAGMTNIILGKSGITAGGIKCRHLFTKIEGSTVSLSRPLTTTIPAGALTSAATLRYTPFKGASIDNGKTPNPEFEPTMLGWLNYVGIVTKYIKGLLGSEEFDIEVWNEQSFGSNFLGINNYYTPAGFPSGSGTTSAIWIRTVAYVRNTANEVSNIGIDNGFVNQSNGTVAGKGNPTYNSRHPYPGRKSFPTVTNTETSLKQGVRDARGNPGTIEVGGVSTAIFIPTCIVWQPEYQLNNWMTECHCLDLAPYKSLIPNNSSGVAHGQGIEIGHLIPEDTSNGLEPSGYGGLDSSGGGPSPQMWITETNMGGWGSVYPSSTAEDKLHLETRVILRAMTAYLTKGLKGIYFYAAGDGTSSDLFMIQKAFFDYISTHPGEYPGDLLGGEVIASIKNFMSTLSGASPLVKPGSIELANLVDHAENIQFQGSPTYNGSTEYPPGSGRFPYFPDLTNKDCFFFSPIQVNDSRRWVFPVYVQTLDIAHEYGGTGRTRFDLPEEKYGMQIKGVKGTGATVSGLDPITGASIPVTVLKSGANEIEIEMKCTDYPRLITVQES